MLSFENDKETSQEKLIHTIKVDNTKDLLEFFQYPDEDIPENSIASFEDALQYTPAIFETA